MSTQGFCDYKLIPGDDKIRVETNSSIVNNLSIYSGTHTIGNSSAPFTGFILFLADGVDDLGATIGFEETNPWLADGSVTNLFNTAGNTSSGFEKSDTDFFDNSK